VTDSTPSARILLIDDDFALSRTISWVLSEHGYHVTSIPSGDELFHRLEADRYDLLLLDISLPGASGFDLLTRLQADDRYRGIPILMISSIAEEETSVKALGLGAVDFVAKPFSIRDLLARVKARLRAGMELNQARTSARSQGETLEILREITASQSPDEIFQVLVRRVAEGLRISRCSIVMADGAPDTATVIAAYENPTLRNMEIALSRYPEIRQALETGSPTIITSLTHDPLLDPVRTEWEAAGQAVLTTSAIVLPFSVRSGRSGVFYLRTIGTEPTLNVQDLGYADQVITAALPTIERAYDLQHAIEEQEQFRHLAETDPLTGLSNRRALDARLQVEVDRALRYRKALSCLVIDVDHFKATNDTYGHQIGDLVLTQLGDLFRREQRTVDLVARYGGEEFVILLPETGPVGARTMAERIIKRVDAFAFGRPNLPVHVTVSIGIATLPEDGVSDADSLLERADANLLRAKAAGRNRYQG